MAEPRRYETAPSSVVFSASSDYMQAAEQELRAAFPAAEFQRLGPDAGCLSAPGVGISAVASVCRAQPVVFVRHLLAEVAQVAVVTVANDPEAISAAVERQLDEHSFSGDISLQVWASGDVSLSNRTDELRRAVVARLRAAGREVGRGGRAHVLSVLVAPEQVVIGFNRCEDALADWPGGRVSLARPKEQISRSEFKLEELFKVFDVPLPAQGIALDLGASPGGWTRMLRRRGLEVWAVDPADLHPTVAVDPLVHHVRSTAGAFLRSSERHFDLIVNDMRMTPERSCAVMVEAATRLNAGAFAIMTLKITPDQPLPIIVRCLRLLAAVYEIAHVRQLFHNRNEITVVARRMAG